MVSNDVTGLKMYQLLVAYVMQMVLRKQYSKHQHQQERIGSAAAGAYTVTTTNVCGSWNGVAKGAVFTWLLN